MGKITLWGMSIKVKNQLNRWFINLHYDAIEVNTAQND